MAELDANELNRREQVTQHYTSALKDLSAQSRAENERIKVSLIFPKRWTRLLADTGKVQEPETEWASDYLF